MDKRSEPRFQVQSPVRIAAIDQPTLVSDALLLDVSGAGMKIITEGWRPVDTLLVVEMENHLVVACVRNVIPRGPKFALGAEKIHSVLKHTLPAGATRAAWHNILLAEMREPQNLAPEAVAPETVAKDLESGALRNAPERPSQEPPAAQRSNQRAPAMETLARHAADEAIPQAVISQAAPLAPEHAPLPERAGETAIPTPHEAAPEIPVRKRPSPSPGADSAPPLASAFPAVSNTAQPGRLLISLPLAPQFGPAYGMAPTADLLTPVSTMPELPPETKTNPRWVASAAVAAGLLGLIVLAFYYGPFRPRASSAPRAAVTQPKVAPLPVPSVTEEPLPAKAVAPPPPTQAAPGKAATLPPIAPVKPTPEARRATVKASAMNWVSACSDGKPAFAKLLMAGDSIDVGFQHMAVFRIGNAAAAEIDVDGKSLGPLGPSGTVKILEISAAGLRVLPSSTSPEAECQSAQVPTLGKP